MKLIFLSILFCLISFSLTSQEFIASELELDITPVSDCSTCDGGCTALAPLPGEMTYRWDDTSGNLLALESTSSGYSSVSDLCIGAYKLTISSGLEVVDEVSFSVTESDVNIGLPGILYSCTTHENLDLQDYLPTNAQSGGVWSNDLGEMLGVVSSENTTNEILTYSILNNGCNNIAQIPLIINSPANIGEFPNVQICEDFDLFNFWAYADTDNYPDPNGVFLNEQFEEVDPVFSPQDSLPGEYNFYYRIDTVPGCVAPVDPFFIRVNAFNQAGEDAVSLVCSSEGQQIDLNSYLSPEANETGLWYDSENQLINNILEESMIEEGLYRYTVTSNVPCLPDVSYVEVLFVDDIESNEDVSLVACSNDQDIYLDDYLENNSSEYGEWYDSEGNVINGIINPSLAQTEQLSYSYEINGVGCSSNQSLVNLAIQPLLSAGNDTAVVVCSSANFLNLNEYLSVQATTLGEWVNSENEIIGPILDIETGFSTVRYVVQQDVCPDQESVVDITIEPELSPPGLDLLTVCQDNSPISLNEEIEINPNWSYAWSDGLGTDLSESFIPTEPGVTDLTLTIDPNNSCDAITAEIELQVEANQFSNETIATQICELTQEVDLLSFVPSEIGSSNYTLVDENNNLLLESTVTLGMGENTFQFTESGLTACESNVLNLTLEQVSFNDAGQDQVLEFCSNQDPINLNSFQQVAGEWSFNNEPVLIEEIELDVTNTGLYQFIAFNSDVCPQSVMELELVVQPIFEYTPLENVELCAGESIQLISPAAGAPYSTVWQTEMGAISSDELNLNDLTEGEVEVSYQITQELCEISNQLSLTIYPEYEIEIQGETELCTGEELNLQLEGGASANWSLNNNLIAQNETIITGWPVNGAQYSAVSVNDLGCVAMDEVIIELNQTPSATIVANQLFGCAPFILELQAESDLDAENIYQWIIDDSSYTGDEMTVNVEEGDELLVQLNVINSNGCINSTSLFQPVLGYTSPVASFDIEDNALSYIDPETEVVNDSYGYTILSWSLDGEEIDGGTDIWTLELGDEPYRAYELCLEATSAEGCIQEHCEIITVNSELLLYIPNAFTPDGDGINEIFKPHYSGNSTELYQFQIFDRWGQEMFFTKNVEQFWNGNVKNGDHYAPPGVYTYVISIKDEFTAEIQTFKGHVTLLR